MRHDPRCAYFNEPPTLRDENDCNCRTWGGKSSTQESLYERIRVLENALREVGGTATDALYKTPRSIRDDTVIFERIREDSLQALAPGLTQRSFQRSSTNVQRS
jgi:hypothetical protein